MDSAPQRFAASRRSRSAVVALLVVTLIWGFTFVWMKEGEETARAKLGPGHLSLAIALFMAVRFGLATVCLIAFVPAARRRLDGAAWRGGAILGALLFAGFLLQMFGLSGVTPGVSAFLTSLYVLFTALVAAFLARRGLRPALVAGVVLATLGAGLVRGRPEFAFNLGELLTVACAFVFALHIVATDRITKHAAALPITLTSFAFVTLASVCLLVPALAADDAPSSAAVLDLLRTTGFWRPAVLTSVLATVIALSMINVYQREIDPVRAAILYAFEPIWTALISIAIGMDAFTPYLWIGGGVLLAGNLVAELGQQPRVRELAVD